MRFAVATLGCKVNQYDSAIIEARLRALGMERCGFEEAADVYIVNTCTVTDRADSESLRLARRARRLNPDARVIMTGCLAQASPEKLARSLEVDAVVGLARPHDLERAVMSLNHERVMVSNLRKRRADIELGAVVLEGHTRAFLKVQEGCDQFCAFCIVPFSRGTSRSVGPRRILAALDAMHERGRREVILTGVHLGGYGRDLNPPINLEVLLEMLAERAPALRIRLSSLDPEELSDRIIALVASDPKFCPHFHLPLQAGENSVLRRMRRRYTVEHYRERVEQVLAAMGDAAIGTDLIAGFPGETDSQFEDYFNFVRELPLAYFHVFPYSARAGTTAAKAAGKLSSDIIKRRAQRLRELGKVKRCAFASRFVGHKLRVLLEERTAAGNLSGYSGNYIKVHVNGSDRMINQEVEVEGTFVQGASLVGQITGTGAAAVANNPAAG
jgi:threonylcarbamoyladenosine tRNA methylthiotransferase MtaB